MSNEFKEWAEKSGLTNYRDLNSQAYEWAEDAWNKATSIAKKDTSYSNLYAIYFNGHYPVGSVAVVEAESIEQADDFFLAQLAKEEPCLVEKNDNTRNDSKCDYKMEELNFYPQPCNILLDGEY